MAAGGEAALPSAEPASEDMRDTVEDLAAFEGVEGSELAVEPGSEQPESEHVNAPPEPSGPAELYDSESPEERFEPDSSLADQDTVPAESDTIGYSGPETQDEQKERERSAREDKEHQP